MTDKPTYTPGIQERRVVYAFEGEVDGLRAEIERLRAALEKIARIDADGIGWAGIAREALGGVNEQSTRVDTGFGSCDVKDFGNGWPVYPEDK